MFFCKRQNPAIVSKMPSPASTSVGAKDPAFGRAELVACCPDWVAPANTWGVRLSSLVTVKSAIGVAWTTGGNTTGNSIIVEIEKTKTV